MTKLRKPGDVARNIWRSCSYLAGGNVDADPKSLVVHDRLAVAEHMARPVTEREIAHYMPSGMGLVGALDAILAARLAEFTKENG